MGDITAAHDDVRELVDIIHYDAHPARTESPEFRKNKEDLHALIKAGKMPACWIDNGHCEGETEIHHFLVEYSAGTEVVWQNVNGVLLAMGKNDTLDNPDEMPNLVALCRHHHLGIGTGIHMVTFPAWILQKFLNEKNLVLFEAAVAALKEKHANHADPAHPDHHLVNAKAAAILHKLAS